MIEKADSIGRVVSVAGSQIICLLAADGASDGPVAVCPLEVGMLVTIPTTRSKAFGLARGVSTPLPSNSGQDEEISVAEIELVGEVLCGPEHSDRFQRGISVFPTLGNPIFPATQDDLRLVHALHGIAAAEIGSIYHDKSLSAHVKIDDLLAKHFAVLGTTGTGKSCAVTVILKAIL